MKPAAIQVRLDALNGKMTPEAQRFAQRLIERADGPTDAQEGAMARVKECRRQSDYTDEEMEHVCMAGKQTLPGPGVAADLKVQTDSTAADTPAEKTMPPFVAPARVELSGQPVLADDEFFKKPASED